MPFNLPQLTVMSAVVATMMASPAAIGQTSQASETHDTALTFNATRYTTVNITVDAVPISVRQYKVVYVAKPIKMAALQYNEQTRGTTTLDDPYTYQTMIISVPESVTASQTAPIWLRVNNSGWFASVATGATAMLKIKAGAALSTSGTDYNAAGAAAAIKAGYVVIDVGSRSRGIRSDDGRWVGKSPAAVVDIKAAIRYLRLNDSRIPGSSERIILTGHSGGGALTAAVAASGNSTDYLPYLAEVGAAGVSGNGNDATSTIKDEVFAAVAYSPISNLGHIDKGYEWQYRAIRDDSNTPPLNGIAYSAGKQAAASTELASAFGAYVNGLRLRRPDGSLLTIDHLHEVIAAELKSEIQRQIMLGVAVPQLGESFTVVKLPSTQSERVVNDWLTLNGHGSSASVAGIDYHRFLRFQATNLTINPPTTARRLKPVPSFDPVGVTDSAPWTLGGESNLFGNEFYSYSNFTEWSWNNNAVKGDGSGKDDSSKGWVEYLESNPALARQLKLINPMDYLTTPSSTPAPYWYVRHGMLDRDTALAMQVLLHHALLNHKGVKTVSFKLPYLIGHTGFADVQESFEWIRATIAAHP